jgi:hypothetical protein
MEALKLKGAQSGQAVRVQRVHMSQRFRWRYVLYIILRSSRTNRHNPRTLVVWGMTGYLSIYMFGRVVLDPLESALEQELKGMPAEDLEEDKPLFIPFPGTTKELKPKPYRGSDPEWKEFVKFSYDRPLQDKIRRKSCS